MIGDDNVEDEFLSVWLLIRVDTGFRWASFNDMSREETPRRGSSVSKRRRLEDRDVDSGSDGKVDFNQEGNAGVGIHGMYKLLYTPFTQLRDSPFTQLRDSL